MGNKRGTRGGGVVIPERSHSRFKRFFGCVAAHGSESDDEACCATNEIESAAPAECDDPGGVNSFVASSQQVTWNAAHSLPIFSKHGKRAKLPWKSSSAPSSEEKQPGRGNLRPSTSEQSGSGTSTFVKQRRLKADTRLPAKFLRYSYH